MHTAFTELAIVLGLAVIFGYLVKYFKQPLITAYLIAGLLLSLVRIIDPAHSLPLTFLPELGIAFVLFFVGMELDLDEIKSLGWPITIAGILQIIITTIVGITIAGSLGFSFNESLYLGLALAFSSTIVVVKMLLEKKDLNSLYGKLSIGILLLEDLVAVLVLMILSVGSSFANLGLQNSLPFTILMLKGVILFATAFVLSRWGLTRIFRAVAHNGELLFLTALTWCFVFIVFAQMLGFSLTIGAFLAGIALASSPFHYHVQGKLKPLRDFFVTLFFIYLGTQVGFTNLGSTLPIILLFTVYTVLFKPVIFLLVLGAFGFKRHTIFQTAINLSQISEFSLIIALVGMQNGSISADVLSIIALTGVLSIFLSSLLISSSHPLYRKLKPFVGFFVHDKLSRSEESNTAEMNLENHIIVIGAHRVGGRIVEYLNREKISHLVLDFNPKMVQALMEKGVPVIYGDISDPEILDSLNLDKSSMVISTSADKEDNLHMLSEIKRRKIDAPIVVRAQTVEDAKELYESGADYVILPEITSGEFLTDKLKMHYPNTKFFKGRSEIELRKLSGKHLSFE